MAIAWISSVVCVLVYPSHPTSGTSSCTQGGSQHCHACQAWPITGLGSLPYHQGRAVDHRQHSTACHTVGTVSL
jgi:hypothetical protein